MKDGEATSGRMARNAQHLGRNPSQRNGDRGGEGLGESV